MHICTFFFLAGVLPAAQGMLAHVSHASLQGTRSALLFCSAGVALAYTFNLFAHKFA